jgi:hypothetical protein
MANGAMSRPPEIRETAIASWQMLGRNHGGVHNIIGRRPPGPGPSPTPDS